MEKAHKKLNVWNEAVELVTKVYETSSQFPENEKFGLTSQMRRAAVSIPSNIAEGAARQGAKDSIQFFVIARGSLSELDTQLEIVLKLGFINLDEKMKLQLHIDKVDSLLSGLIRYRKSKN